MNKRIIICLLVSCFMVGPVAFAGQEVVPSADKPTWAQQRKEFKARRKQIDKLVRQYKKSSAVEQPAIKTQLEELVSQRVDDSFTYMQQRISEERARLDDWEKKIKEDQANISQIKAQRVEDLLTGAAKKKHKQAKKRWKKQLKEQQRKNLQK